MTDGEINEAVAKALGYEVAGRHGLGVYVTNRASTHDQLAAGVVMEYRAWTESLDACFRDLVPEASDRGWSFSLIQGRWSTWKVMGFGAGIGDGVEINGEPLPRALCLAWLATKDRP